MLLQTSSTTSFKSKQTVSSAPTPRQASSTKLRNSATFSTFASRSISSLSAPPEGVCRASSACLPFLEEAFDLREQPRVLDGFRVEVVAARLARLLAVSRHRMGGERDDGNLTGGRIALENPCRLPPVEDGQAHVHQNEVRGVAARERDPLLSLHRHDDLVAAADETAREHVAVHLVVLDEEDFRHRDPYATASVRREARIPARRSRSIGLTR